MKNYMLLMSCLLCSIHVLSQEAFKGNPSSVESTYQDLTETSEYTWAEHTTTHYNVSGKVTIWAQGDGDQEGNRELSRVNKYDENGNLTSVQAYYFGKPTWKTKLKYDEKNNLIEEKSAGEKSVYIYNEAGQLITLEEYEDGKLEYTTTFVYNEKGQKTEETWSDAQGAYEIYTYYFSYDSRGNLAEERRDFVSEDEYLKDQSTKYIYNNNDILVETVTTNNEGEITGKSSFKHDAQGQVTWMFLLWTDSDNQEQAEETTTYTYEYDATGNWIKQSTFKGDVMVSTDERVITYY